MLLVFCNCLLVNYLFLQLCMYLSNPVTGNDYYRTLVCNYLWIKSALCLYQHAPESTLMSNAVFFLSYICNDLLYMFKYRVSRVALWFHHGFSLFTYGYVLLDGVNNWCLNVCLVSEMLSCMNAFLRHRNPGLLKKWRLLTIILIRLPIHLTLGNYWWGDPIYNHKSTVYISRLAQAGLFAFDLNIMRKFLVERKKKKQKQIQ